MKLKPINAAIALSIAAGTATFAANATEIDNELVQRVGENVIITDESGETLIKAAGNQGNTIEDNDVLLGALDFTTINSPLQGTENLTANRQLTGLFATQIVSQTDTGSDSTSAGGTTFNIIDFDMGAAGAVFWTTNFAGIDTLVDNTFGAGTWASVGGSTMGFLFDDSRNTGTIFDRTGGLSELADASDGLLRAIVGFSDVDDYWIARGPDDVTAFGTGSTLEELGGFAFGLSFLAENFAVDFADTVPAPEGLGFIGSPYAPNPNPDAQFFGNGDLLARGSVPGQGDFAVYNRVDVTVAPTAVPEPGVLALASIGLIGLGAARRRKFGTA